MKQPSLRATIGCLVIAITCIAATSKPIRQLTPQRLAELIGPKEAPKPERYTVTVDGLRLPAATRWSIAGRATSNDGGPISVTVPAGKPEGVIKCIREMRFPSEFDPPMAGADQPSAIVPVTPTAFEAVDAGWSIRLSARPHGKIVAVSGAADFVEAELVRGSYGPVSAPIFGEDGRLISPNRIDQPKIQTTTTRFQIFAVPGESYDVTLYRGAKAEKHRITVSTE